MEFLAKMALAARGIFAALMGAVYTISPIDAVPDVIVGIGWLDDMIVLGLTGFYIWRLLSRRQAARTLRPVVIPQLPPR
jgi:uncharacterized membrane protein YkvA (DUF1232 family)